VVFLKEYRLNDGRDTFHERNSLPLLLHVDGDDTDHGRSGQGVRTLAPLKHGKVQNESS
jgi:hypothetical protein